MEEAKHQIELKAMNKLKLLEERISNRHSLRVTSDCSQEVLKVVDNITKKMSQCKIGELHPPFLPKTISKFRNEYFLPLKKNYSNLINSNKTEQFQKGMNVLNQFVMNLDNQYIDLYIEQIRQPYIRKIFNQNYEFDKLDFKEINNQYKIRAQIQNLLGSASEWLVQIEKTQDLLERTQLYFDIKTPIIIQKIKKGKKQAQKNKSWGASFLSMVRNVASYSLRKSSKVVQSTLFTAMAPAAAMLTIAIIGGTSTIPFSSDMSAKLLLGPLVAISVPFVLDGLASTIERKEFMHILEEWTITLQKIAVNIAKYNSQIQQSILICCQSKNIEQYNKQKLNLQKYVQILQSNLSNITDFNEQSFEQMRTRTEAYFKKYVQIEDGEWTVVIPMEQYNSNNFDNWQTL